VAGIASLFDYIAPKTRILQISVRVVVGPSGSLFVNKVVEAGFCRIRRQMPLAHHAGLITVSVHYLRESLLRRIEGGGRLPACRFSRIRNHSVHMVVRAR